MNIDIFDTTKPTLSPKAQKRIKELERIIPHLVHLHGEGEPCLHPDTDVIVADIEFDAMWAELIKLKPKSSALRSGSSTVADPYAKKVKHDPPMTSISKANGKLDEKDKILEKWIENVKAKTGCSGKTETWIVQAYKRDGVACSVYYKKGKLVSAGLRPRDGVNGEDVTKNVKYVSGIPQQLPLPLTCTIRGELECRISTFNNLNGSASVGDREFANPRNYTSGSIRQFKTPSKTDARQLSFTAYCIESLDKYQQYYKTEAERAKWCNTVLKVPFVRIEPFSYENLQKLDDGAGDLDYEVDGAVLSIDDLDLQEQAGRHGNTPTGNPFGKLAWKFADDVAEANISSIVWETGRTGKITPVLNFPKVALAGTRVGRAAGYSLGFILRNQINVGMKVRIRKSGKIIPESLGFYRKGKFVDKEDMLGGSDNLPKKFDFDVIKYPKECPSCKQKTEIKEGQKHGLLELNCENKLCPARNIKTFVNYLQKFGCKGVAESVTEKLVEAGLVKSFADLYTLKVSEVFKALGSARISLLTVARIHMVPDPEQVKDNKTLAVQTADAMRFSKTIPLAQLIACLGISGASKGTGRALALHYRNLDKMMAADAVDFETVEDVGAKTAANLEKYFEQNKTALAELLKHVTPELPKTGKFNNKVFVFTGGLAGGKDKWKQAVEDEGAKVSSSVSKKTHYVIIGDDPGQKAEKAEDLKAAGEPIVIVRGVDALKKLLSV